MMTADNNISQRTFDKRDLISSHVNYDCFSPYSQKQLEI